METRVSSTAREVVIADRQPMVLINERINPMGKERITEALEVGNLEIVSKEALAQVHAKADIIGINVSTFGVDEVIMPTQAVHVVMDTVDAPLCLDSANPEALATTLKVYKGRPLINSVTDEEHSIIWRSTVSCMPCVC